VTRLQELLTRELVRGRDDDELDELAHLLDRLRRVPGGAWERWEIDGQVFYRRTLDCGHWETVCSETEPRGAILTTPGGVERELPLRAVCHECDRLRGEA